MTDTTRTYTVKWSEPDQEWVATVTGAPYLSVLTANPITALTGLISVLDGTDEGTELE